MLDNTEKKIKMYVTVKDGDFCHKLSDGSIQRYNTLTGVFDGVHVTHRKFKGRCFNNWEYSFIDGNTNIALCIATTSPLIVSLTSALHRSNAVAERQPVILKSYMRNDFNNIALYDGVDGGMVDWFTELPKEREQRAHHTVRCAEELNNAMGKVNNRIS